ncbi:hypothetical protein Glove_321g47 [Diversispora epigaea]|uniref:Uncharacterized protein n=1 Tax=Diversispora epigaea TaxID=1348612 RepID=A0A397HST9_9GLOM|nr:hypothetical protein Glove_321g47 [Diversispora epigaea]
MFLDRNRNSRNRSIFNILDEELISNQLLIEISNITADNNVSNISFDDETEKIKEISIESEKELVDEFFNIFKDYLSPNYDLNEPIDPKSSGNFSRYKFTEIYGTYRNLSLKKLIFLTLITIYETENDMDNWFIVKDLSKHLENVLRCRGCNSDFVRKKFTKSSKSLANQIKLMRQLINNNKINEMIYTENNIKGLKILNTRQSVRFFLEMDQFELFLSEMLKPFSENISFSTDGILDLIVAYYNDIYENLKFRKLFEINFLNSIIISLRINKYCHCQIGSEIFDSTFSSRHQKSSYILAKFASEDNSIDIYLEQMCNVELWDTEFYPKS